MVSTKLHEKAQSMGFSNFKIGGLTVWGGIGHIRGNGPTKLSKLDLKRPDKILNNKNCPPPQSQDMM